MKDIKYLILDCGKVLFYPTSGNWFITPNFFNVVKKDKIDLDKLEEAFKYISSKYINNIVAKTEKEEFEVFKKFYSYVFEYCNYEINEEDIEKIAYDMTYVDEKLNIYDDVKEELERYSNKYKIILLSDNWPCCFRIMKNHDIYKYFDEIYVSSMYGVRKIEGDLFDYPIKKFNIKKNEAIFVDDNIKLLRIAAKKGLIPMLMDREYSENTAEFKVIHNLKEIEEKYV